MAGEEKQPGAGETAKLPIPPPAGKRKPRRPAPENKQYTPPENKADEIGEDDDYARDVD